MCEICNLVKKHGVKEKFRISHVPTAQLLSDAASAKQDDVHVRFADLQTPERLIAADMYCHSNCKRAFLHEFTEQNSACVFSDEKLSSSFKKALDLAAAKSILEGATKNGDEDLIQKFLQFYNQTSDELYLVLCVFPCHLLEFLPWPRLPRFIAAV